jgi:hypothetical protein
LQHEWVKRLAIYIGFAIMLYTILPKNHSLSRYMMIWKPGKFQSHKMEDFCFQLFDVELCLTVQPQSPAVSTSLNIIHRGCTFHISYPYWTVTSLYIIICIYLYYVYCLNIDSIVNDCIFDAGPH